MQLSGVSRRRLLDEGRNRVARWREAGPTLFLHDTTGLPPTEQQQKLFAAVRDFEPGGGKWGVSVTSGQGTGKTFALAVLTLWFLTVFRDSLVHAMASKEKQVRLLLWGELQRLIRRSQFLSSFFEWQATRILVRNEDSGWSAIANTARSVESIQGEHSEHMLVLIDEASGVEDHILEGIIGGLTQSHNLAVLTSQGTRPSGTFYDSHHKDRKQWHRLQFDSRDSPLVDLTHITRLEAKYGKGSPVVAVRVDGDFPVQSEHALIRLDWIEQARDRQIIPGHNNQPIELGVDVARFGGDSTVCVARQGPNVLSIDRWLGADLVETSGRVTEIKNCWKASSIKIDGIGVGGGVVDMLSASTTDAEVVDVNVGESSDDPSQWPRLRDQIWFEFADRLKAGLIAFDPSIPPETVEDLEAEIIAVEYSFMPSGARKVDSKDAMRKRTGGSPDVADALMLAYLEMGGPIVTWV